MPQASAVMETQSAAGTASLALVVEREVPARV